MNLVKKVRDFIDKTSATGGKQLYEMAHQEARDFLLKAQNKITTPADCDVTEIDVPLNNGRKMQLKIVHPQNVEGKTPLIFYIHGGGWILGNFQTHARLVGELAEQTKATVVFPVYAPSPESQFPQTTDDLFASLRFIYENADTYNLDKNNLVLAGDSVGGNMALALALMNKQQNAALPLKFMLLLYPVTDADFSTPSYQQFADGPWLTKKAMKWFWNAYAPDEQQRKSILACPLRATENELFGLPPALIITAENDVLRDEGEAMARKLDAAGVETGSIRINGTTHDFLMLNALKDTAPSREALAVSIDALKRVFKR